MVDEPQKALNKSHSDLGMSPRNRGKMPSQTFSPFDAMVSFCGVWKLELERPSRKKGVSSTKATNRRYLVPFKVNRKLVSSATENGELNSVKQHVSTKIQFISSSCQINQMGPINRQHEEFVGLHIGHTSLPHHACSSYSMIVGIGKHRKAQKDGHGIDYDCSLCQVDNKICYVPVEWSKQNTQPFPNRVYEIECAPVQDDIQWGFATGFTIQPFFGGYCLCGNPQGVEHTQENNEY